MDAPDLRYDPMSRAAFPIVLVCDADRRGNRLQAFTRQGEYIKACVLVTSTLR